MAASGVRDVGVVIVAAGSGSRVGTTERKQFRWIGGKPMLLHSLQRFQERDDVGMVVVVLPKDMAADPPPWLFQCDLDRLLVSVGGRERSESVRNGIEDLPPELPLVLVHDAARPFAPSDMTERVVAELRASPGCAVIPVLPLFDTIKKLAADGTVEETLDRNLLVRVQTPQGFPRTALIEAHAAALQRGQGATDDAAMCEQIGVVVKCVAGSELAMKITTDVDFGIAEVVLEGAG